MKEYIICGKDGTSAAILPEKGATVVSFRHKDVEFLYKDKENLNSSERPRCGIPFLFPIFGWLKDARYLWDGQEYHMDIHGFGHTSVWEVLEHRPDTLVLVLNSNEQTLAQYPFRFRVTLTFRIGCGTLTVSQRYENLDSVPLPYNYGFHPYFLTEKPEHIRVETTADTFFDFAVGGRPFGHDRVSITVPDGAPEAGAVLLGVRGPTILRNPAEGRQLTMEFDDSFHTHVLWTLSGKSFLCVEPVNGNADSLNTGIYMTLQPGEHRDATVTFRAEII